MHTSYFNGITCPKEYLLALKDTLNVVSGKWKLAIVSSLLLDQKRFSDIQRHIPGITPRMLSRELKELEINGIIHRTVTHSTAVTVSYTLTPSGRLLNKVVDTMVEWGLGHREQVMTEVEFPKV